MPILAASDMRWGLSIMSLKETKVATMHPSPLGCGSCFEKNVSCQQFESDARGLVPRAGHSDFGGDLRLIVSGFDVVGFERHREQRFLNGHSGFPRGAAESAPALFMAPLRQGSTARIIPMTRLIMAAADEGECHVPGSTRS